MAELTRVGHAKWAVEIHGARMTVIERQGGGAEFLIRLPLAESSLMTQA